LADEIVAIEVGNRLRHLRRARTHPAEIAFALAEKRAENVAVHHALTLIA
jgi:hypothetical protein